MAAPDPRPRPAQWEQPDLQDFIIHRQLTTYGGRPMAPMDMADKFLKGLFGGANSVPFMTSKPHFEDTSVRDRQWEPCRILGQGSYGSVGLWVRRNAHGNIIDEVAIKQGDREADLEVQFRPGLAKEAASQVQLNARGVENVVHIRRYKCFFESHQHRFYFEFSPYGDLERLRFRYRVWDRYLPELFLWHVFHSLAQVAVQMATAVPPWQNYQTPVGQGPANHPNNWYMLHLDIKPQNILLGYEPHPKDPNDPTSEYPTIKIADFGFAHFTGPTDHINNPGHLQGFGTPNFKAPEQFGFGDNWQPPVNPPGAQLGPELNIWGFGRVMVDLLTLAEPEMVIDNMANNPNTFRERLNHVLHIGSIGTKYGAPQYSPALRTAIWLCLHPNMAARLTPAQLLVRTQQGLNNCKQVIIAARQDPGVPEAAERVYFRGNSINQMLPGVARFPATYQEARAIRDGDYVDLDQGNLRPPPGPKWARHRHVFRQKAWMENAQWATDTQRNVILLAPPPQPFSDQDHFMAAPETRLQGNIREIYDLLAGIQVHRRNRTTLGGRPRAVRKFEDNPDHLQPLFLPALPVALYHYFLRHEGLSVQNAFAALQRVHVADDHPLEYPANNPAMRDLIYQVQTAVNEGVERGMNCRTRRQVEYCLRANRRDTAQGTRAELALADLRRIYQRYTPRGRF